MSVSNVLATSPDPTYPISSRKQERRQDFTELADALKAGDLSSAQQAFSAFQQTFSASSVNTQTQVNQGASPRDTVTADISTLGKDLQAGDLTTAQADFTQLQKDVQSLGKGHHQHHHKVSATTQDDAATNTSDTGTSLDQLLAYLNSQAAAGASSTDSGTNLQQLIALVKSFKSSAGSNVSASSLQSLLGSNLNISA